MTHEQISDALFEKQKELLSSCQMTAHKQKLLDEITRLQFLYLEEGIINLDNRIIALLALCNTVYNDLHNQRKKKKVDYAIGFVFANSGSLFGVGSLAKKLKVSAHRITESYHEYLLKAA